MTTRWSRVLLAGDADVADAQEALADLCRDYWKPLYHFARRKGFQPEDAQDLTQGFILHLLAKNSIANADQSRGKFRTFLIGAFCHFISNYRRDQNAQKRGGSRVIVSMDEPEAEAVYAAYAQDWLTPERQYERSWAFSLLERVMQRLREEYVKAKRVPLFEAIQPHLTGGGQRPGYAKIGAELGMSESAVTISVHRMRKRYGQLLREEIAATVATEAEVEEELRYLIEIVSGSTEKSHSL